MTGVPLASTRDITGVILAGGRGSRLGGVDKGLVRLLDRPLVEYVIDALRPQVAGLLISANRNQEIYESYGFPVIADATDDYDGPLAGILSALRAVTSPYVLIVPCDAPSLPSDLAARLAVALVREKAAASTVVLDGRLQPVFALLRCTLAGDLEQYMAHGGRGTGEWMLRHQAAQVDFSDAAEAFVNINTPQELQDRQRNR